MKCSDCCIECVKNGKTISGIQRYRCKKCKKNFQENYAYRAYDKEINAKITSYVKEGLGIRSIARLLNISCKTVSQRILQIASLIDSPIIPMEKTFQVDELITYVRNKKNRICIVLALCEETKEVVAMAVGRRNNNTLKQVVNSLLLSNPKKIKTDRLPNYLRLIPKHLHHVKRRNINHVERRNLQLRTHLKRVQRRTISYSKNLTMLRACVNVFLWG